MAPQCHPSVTTASFLLQPSFPASPPTSFAPVSAPFNIFRSRFTIPEIKRKIYSASHVRACEPRRPAQHDRMGIHFAEPFSFWPFAVHSFFEREQKEKKRRKKEYFVFPYLCFPFFFSRRFHRGNERSNDRIFPLTGNNSILFDRIFTEMWKERKKRE